MTPEPAAQPQPAVNPPGPAGELPLYRRLAHTPASPTALATLPDQYYAVQIIALDSPAAVEAFASERSIDGLSAARVESRGRILYVVLLGIYETAQDARRASTDLPPPLQDLHPWVRSLADLKRAMRRAESRSDNHPARPFGPEHLIA